MIDILVALAFLVNCRGEDPNTNHLKPVQITTVSLCDLLAHPDLFDQKTIHLQAIYRYGAEWSEIYCLECSESGSVWLEFDEKFEASMKRSLKRKIAGNGDRGRTVKVAMIGKFYGSGGRYGHLGASRFKIVVSQVEHAEILLNDSPIPNALPAQVKSKAKCTGSS